MAGRRLGEPRRKPVLVPDDVKGMKVRGGSREMDLMLKGAGAAVVSMPSNELYAAMQTGTMDVCMTTSTSLISFRLEEIAKNLTTGRGKGFFFVFEPLLMSKQVFDALPKDQQTAIMEVGPEMEKFALEKAKADDVAVAKVYEKAGIKTFDIDQAQVDKWKAVARDTCWKDYADKSAGNAEFLKLWQQVSGVNPLDLLNRAIVVSVGDRPSSCLLRADLLGRAALFLAGADRLAGRVLGLPADRRHLLRGRLGAVAARPYRHRGDGDPPAAGRAIVGGSGRRLAERAVLRLLRLEVVDPAG